MKIDNFEIWKKFLTFETPYDRYIVHVLRRPKDVKAIGNAFGSNECQRLLRTYYIDSLEYFEKKIPAIKELCISNQARAYIIPQVRNNEDCLLNLAAKVIDTIQMKNYSAKPEHILRAAYCEFHKSRRKIWILDLDNDEMHGWETEKVLELIKSQLKKIGKPEDDAFLVPTKSGTHIVTTPFNLQEAVKLCPMLYEGEKTIDGKKSVGWLHKDGMSLLYLDLPD